MCRIVCVHRQHAVYHAVHCERAYATLAMEAGQDGMVDVNFSGSNQNLRNSLTGTRELHGTHWIGISSP